ncbi:MAG: hypothetical protein WA885_19455 [Phormidesmis sp.]
MTSFNSDALLTDLSEDETAQLNGGRRCFYVRVVRRVRRGFYWFYQYFWVIRCY